MPGLARFAALASAVPFALPAGAAPLFLEYSGAFTTGTLACQAISGSFVIDYATFQRTGCELFVVDAPNPQEDRLLAFERSF